MAQKVNIQNGHKYNQKTNKQLSIVTYQIKTNTPIICSLGITDDV